MTGSAIRVTVWGEFVHERQDETVAAIYPDGMHEEIARAVRELADTPVEVRTATLADPGQGLPEPVLEQTDVLVWWGHVAHDEVEDDLAAQVQARVLRGMGLVVLHSGAGSKPFRRLMGTTCTFRWREDDERELIWIVDPAHAIARGLPEVIVVPQHEMYGEPFDIPAPDELVFVSSYAGGEVFRSGCCFRRGDGRIFYFEPGHETNPVYHQPEIRRAIANAVVWAGRRGAGAVRSEERRSVHAPPGWFEPK